MDQLMRMIRPPWVELWKLRSSADMDAAAARLFGYQPSKLEEQRKPYTAAEYTNRFGISLSRLKNFYAEVGGTEALEGHVSPATTHIPIFPILAIRQTHRGNYEPEGLRSNKGFFNKDRTRAWIPVDEYEELLGDTFYKEIIDSAERIKQAAAKHEPSQRAVQVIPTTRSDEFSPNERAIIDTILRKAPR